MRTQDEIVARIEAVKADDIFGAQTSDLLVYLDFERARPYLKETATADAWADAMTELTDERVRAEMAEYMPFAWSKVEDHRGLSASRNIEHMRAFLWLLDDGTLEKMEAAPYENYGAPQLRLVCETYRLPMPETEAVRRMSEGRPCSDDCGGGCGR